MDKTFRDAVNILKGTGPKVFERLPKAETRPRQKVDYDELFNEHANKLCNGYKMNNSLLTLKNYFQQLKHFDAGAVLNDPNIFKGLLVYGGFGTGKTTFFKIIRSMARELVVNHGYSGLWFSEVSAPSFVQEFMSSTKKGYEGTFVLESYYKGKLYIDDLGAEKLCFNEYELFEDVLFERHRNGAMTYVTTNLTPKQLGGKYGPRIGDRLPEFFNIIKLDGKSMRE